MNMERVPLKRGKIEERRNKIHIEIGNNVCGNGSIKGRGRGTNLKEQIGRRRNEKSKF